jgi:hypothetical protein
MPAGERITLRAWGASDQLLGPSPDKRDNFSMVPLPERPVASASAQLPTTGGRSLLFREIERSDFEEVSELLGRRIGYPRDYFLELLQRMTTLPVVAGRPRYGRVLSFDGKIVGAILLIFSARMREAVSVVRCHVTGWAVEPAFKSLAALFFARDLAHKDVTYLNLSARWSPHTIPIIEAQGFVRYSDGEFLSIPALQFSAPDRNKGTIVSGESLPSTSFEATDRKLLLDHSSYGCISLWCLTPERAYPFVFRRRLFKRIVPGAQLIYCSDIADFVRFAGPIGRYLARRGNYVVRIDASGPIPGLIGVYQNGVDCRYYKGPKPRLGDLSYTHLAMCDYLPRKKMVAES